MRAHVAVIDDARAAEAKARFSFAITLLRRVTFAMAVITFMLLFRVIFFSLLPMLPPLRATLLPAARFDDSAVVNRHIRLFAAADCHCHYFRLSF